MINQKLLIILLIVFCTASLSNAQDYAINKDSLKMEKKLRKKKDRYLPFGLGVVNHKVKDDGMSPLTYKGFGLHYRLGFYGKNERKMNFYNIGYSRGSISSKNYPSSVDVVKTSVFRIELDYGHLRRIKVFEAPKINWMLGGSANLFINGRLNLKMGNSALSYEGGLSFGLLNRFERTFKMRKRSIILSHQLNIPFYSLIARPGYAFIPDIAANEYINVDNTSGMTFNNFFRVNSLFELSYVLKNDNQIRLGYIWDYYSYYKDYNDVQVAMHGIVLSTIFKF